MLLTQKNDTEFLVWISYAGAPGNGKVFYRRSTDGGATSDHFYSIIPITTMTILQKAVTT